MAIKKIKFTPSEKQLINLINDSGLAYNFVAEKAGIGYMHLTRILNFDRPMGVKTREKLQKFADSRKLN